jgi:hypothetical protein
MLFNTYSIWNHCSWMVVVIEVSHAPRTYICLRACHNQFLPRPSQSRSNSPSTRNIPSVTACNQSIHSFIHSKYSISIYPFAFAFSQLPNSNTRRTVHPNPSEPQTSRKSINPPTSLFPTRPRIPPRIDKILQKKHAYLTVLTYLDDHTLHRVSFPLRFPISRTSPHLKPDPRSP